MLPSALFHLVVFHPQPFPKHFEFNKCNRYIYPNWVVLWRFGWCAEGMKVGTYALKGCTVQRFRRYISFASSTCFYVPASLMQIPCVCRAHLSHSSVLDGFGQHTHRLTSSQVNWRHIAAMWKTTNACFGVLYVLELMRVTSRQLFLSLSSSFCPPFPLSFLFVSFFQSPFLFISFYHSVPFSFFLFFSVS